MEMNEIIASQKHAHPKNEFNPYSKQKYST